MSHLLGAQFCGSAQGPQGVLLAHERTTRRERPTPTAASKEGMTFKGRLEVKSLGGAGAGRSSRAVNCMLERSAIDQV